MTETLSNPFKKWRIYAVILLGLAVSGGFLTYSLTRDEFQRVDAGQGNFRWEDSNKNGKVDKHNSSEFVHDKTGSYIKKTALQILGSVQWSAQSVFWLFLAMLGMVGRDLGYMWRIRTLTKKNLSWRQSFRVIMLWEFASALAPGVMSGATVAMFILNREKIALGRATAVVICTAFLDNLYFLLFIPLAFLLFPGSQLFPESSTISGTLSTIFWTGYTIFGIICLALFTSIFLYPKFVGQLLRIFTRIPFLKRFEAGAQKTGSDMAETALLLRKESFVFWLKSFGATCISWTSRFLVINFILQAFIGLGWFQQIQVFVKQFVLWMFLRISPTPGGSGTAEWSFSELLSDTTDSLVLLGTLAVLWRLITYFPYLLIGSALIPRWLNRRPIESKNTSPLG